VVKIWANRWSVVWPIRWHIVCFIIFLIVTTTSCLSLIKKKKKNAHVRRPKMKGPCIWAYFLNAQVRWPTQARLARLTSFFFLPFNYFSCNLIKKFNILIIIYLGKKIKFNKTKILNIMDFMIWVVSFLN
jgi:hypothetical protein